MKKKVKKSKESPNQNFGNNQEINPKFKEIGRRNFNQSLEIKEVGLTKSFKKLIKERIKIWLIPRG